MITNTVKTLRIVTMIANEAKPIRQRKKEGEKGFETTRKIDISILILLRCF
jgi:hypothetical protein